MDYNNKMKKLIEKYWSGETTLEEEVVVREYLKNQSTDSAERQYVDFLTQESQLSSSLRFEDLLENIEAAPVTKIRPIQSIIRWVPSVAAAIIFCIAMFFVLKPEAPIDTSQHLAQMETYDNPEQAYEEVKGALLMISSKMNKSRAMASDKIAKTEVYTEIFK